MGEWTLSNFLGILFLLMIMQVIGTHLQGNQYRKSVSKLHKLGNVGIGAERNKIAGGNIVIIACKSDGTITGGEEMRGLTIFTTFKEIEGIIGKNICDLKTEYKSDEKRYKAHIQAIEALENRLNGSENLCEH